MGWTGGKVPRRFLPHRPGSQFGVFGPAAKVPAVRVIAPLSVSVARLPPPVTDPPPVLLIVRLLNVWGLAVPLRFRAPEPLKLTVPLPGVNVVPLVRVQSPATLTVAGAVNVP